MRQRHSKILYKVDSKGKMRQWSMSVFEKGDDLCDLVTTSGLVKGSKTNRSKPVHNSKVESAMFRAVKLMNNTVEKKMRTGYHLSPEEAQNSGVLFAPMKAHTCDPKKLPAPMYSVQPKINGLRAPYNYEEDKIHTKTGLTYCLPSLQKGISILSMMLGASVDGELFVPGLTAPEIKGVVSNLDDTRRSQVEYHIYDCMMDEGFEKRWPKVQAAFQQFQLTYGTDYKIYIVPTFRVRFDRDTKQWYERWVGQGYEGLMIRIDGVGYEYGKRTKNLLKWKPVIDKEFPVVGITYEIRVHDNMQKRLVEFICECEGGRFKVVPKWDVDKRFQWYLDNKDKDLDTLLDSLNPLQCEFREYTKNGIPFHAVGIDFRDPSY